MFSKDRVVLTVTGNALSTQIHKRHDNVEHLTSRLSIVISYLYCSLVAEAFGSRNIKGVVLNNELIKQRQLFGLVIPLQTDSCTLFLHIIELLHLLAHLTRLVAGLHRSLVGPAVSNSIFNVQRKEFCCAFGQNGRERHLISVGSHYWRSSCIVIVATA